MMTSMFLLFQLTSLIYLMSILYGNNDEYVPEAKRMYIFNRYYEESNSGDMPEIFCFVRHEERSVRPEVYSVMHKLSSAYHMSKAQIKGSIITIANMMFNREWKPYKPRQEPNCNALPSMKNLLHTESHFEAMALCSIVEEINKIAHIWACPDKVVSLFRVKIRFSILLF